MSNRADRKGIKMASSRNGNATGREIGSATVHLSLQGKGWRLSGHVDRVFGTLTAQYRDKLQEFVIWFLKESRRYVQYFDGSYQYSSSIVYAFGRPLFRSGSSWQWKSRPAL